MTLSAKLTLSDIEAILLADDSGDSFKADLVGVDGASLRALSKAWGKSMDPGGTLCLLGLPWGVCAGLINACLESTGVEGRSMGPLPERV